MPSPVQLPGIALAALVTLSLGAVLGPEAPLIALGGGLAAWVVGLARRDPPAQATAVVGSAGSFAAVSTLLGSPLLGAFLLMEASGLGGPMLGLVLVPGLVAAGVGSLVFVGLAVLYAEASGHGVSDVLFLGQDALGPLMAGSATYSVGALLLLVACKGLAYGASLAAFRGGPVFPAMYLGAAGGIALSQLPGLSLVAGVARASARWRSRCSGCR